MNQTYYKSFTVPDSACDADGICRPSFFSVCMENIATEDSIRLGQGADILAEKYNAGWMILSSDLLLQRPMKAGETLQALTWTRGVKGASVLRDFVFCIDGGEVLRATQQWIVADLSKRLLVNPRRMPELATVCPEFAFRDRPSKISLTEQVIIVAAQTVPASEIDRNGHMNNAFYLRRAESFLPSEWLQMPYRLQLEYRNELTEGQNFDVYAFTDGASGIVFRRDGRDCFLLRLENIVQQR